MQPTRFLQYNATDSTIMKNTITTALCLLACIGCTWTRPAPQAPTTQARAAAVVLLARSAVPDMQVTNQQGPDVDPAAVPVAGDNCPKCNDPAGKCGVGKVGDGITCRPCRACRGDGRCDAGDPVLGVADTPDALPDAVAPRRPLVSDILKKGSYKQVTAEPLPAPAPDPVPVTIELHVSPESVDGWAVKWWQQERPYWADQPGVTVTYVKEDEGEAYLYLRGRTPARVDGLPTRDIVTTWIETVRQ